MIKHQLRSGELSVSGDQWSTFIYTGYTFEWLSTEQSSHMHMLCHSDNPVNLMKSYAQQAYKHIFTVEKEPKATQSRNAGIHGMTCITLYMFTI